MFVFCISGSLVATIGRQRLRRNKGATIGHHRLPAQCSWAYGKRRITGASGKSPRCAIFRGAGEAFRFPWAGRQCRGVELSFKRWVLHLIWAFLNSVFITAIVGSMAGAGAGAYGAQWIVARGRQRAELLTEKRNTNATIMVAVGICNTFLEIKRQTVKPLKDFYDAQRAAYHEHAKTDFVAGLRSLYLPPFPLEILRQQAFAKLSLSGRPLLLINALGDTIHGLNTSIDARNDLIASYKHNSTFSTESYFAFDKAAAMSSIRSIRLRFTQYITIRMMAFFSVTYYLLIYLHMANNLPMDLRRYLQRCARCPV
jgi:hypothetical protein